MTRAKLPNKDFIWTPQLAYAVGLFVTDGSLSKDGRHVIMRSSEPCQLKTFNQCVSKQNKIETTRNGNIISYRIQIGDVQLYKWLVKIGLFPNKTYTIGKINIPDKYFIDFLRGHLDGDGSITTYKDFYNTKKNPKYIYNRLCVKFISASQIHITWLQNKVIQLLEIRGSLHEAKPKDNKRVSMWILKFGKKESLKLLSKLYYSSDIPCLQRKRDKANEFIRELNLVKN